MSWRLTWSRNFEDGSCSVLLKARLSSKLEAPRLQRFLPQKLSSFKEARFRHAFLRFFKKLKARFLELFIFFKKKKKKTKTEFKL